MQNLSEAVNDRFSNLSLRSLAAPRDNPVYRDCARIPQAAIYLDRVQTLRILSPPTRPNWDALNRIAKEFSRCFLDSLDDNIHV
jgi:hypothetical protein